MDIEEDIKILKNLKKYLNLLIYEGTHKIIYNDLGWDEKTIDCINAIEHILAEREADKKRIKELEEDLITAYMKGYADAEEKYREKIKEKRDEINKKYEDSKDENGESPYYYPEYTIKVLEKLLEEK